MLTPPQVYTCRITLISEMLGSQPAAEDVHSQYIQSKAPAGVLVHSENGLKTSDLERMLIKNAVAHATADGENEEELRGRTVFLRDERGRPVLRDYVFKGFFKEAWRANKKIAGSESASTKQGVSEIDRYLFIEGVGDHRDKRYVILNLNGGSESLLERPLRAQTAQGPRVALASSELVPARTYMDLRIVNLAPNLLKQELLEEWLNYGRWMGLGQWRTGSHGRFEYTLRAVQPERK